MKKAITLFLFLLIIFSCTSDVKFNTPGFQARKDNFNWKADITNGKITNGMIVIEAFIAAETVTLTVPAPLSNILQSNPVIHKFGVTVSEPINEREASYKNTGDGAILLYKTNTIQSNGQLEITSFNLITRKLSGTFKFNATYQGVNPAIAPNVNFQEGFIFDVIVK